MSKPFPSLRNSQIWEAVDDCDVQIQYLFTAPITFSGSVRLAVGERVCITSETNNSQPTIVNFLPVRYDELHDHLVSADIRETPRYIKYALSVKAEYFYEHFILVKDAT